MLVFKVFKCFCYEAPQIGATGAYFSLNEWGHNTIVFKGYDDGGKLYRLPDGYYLGKDVSGYTIIYNSNDKYCPPMRDYNTPTFWDPSSGKLIHLCFVDNVPPAVSQ